MRPYISVILLLLLFVFNANAGLITIKGYYQGKNIYVQNPFTSTMTDFCANDVFVNGKKVLSGVRQSAFEVDLSGLEMYSPVEVKITHKDDCKPRVLNPQVLKSEHNFKFTSFHIDHNKIQWSTKGEGIGGKFVVQQFVYNNWIIISELKGIGTPIDHNYDIAEPHHSGVNRYRVKYISKKGQVFYSPVKDHESVKEPVTFEPKKNATTTLFLSRPADYEILSKDGKSIRKGSGKEVPLRGIESGEYFLNIDNKTEKFTIK